MSLPKPKISTPAPAPAPAMSGATDIRLGGQDDEEQALAARGILGLGRLRLRATRNATSAAAAATGGESAATAPAAAPEAASPAQAFKLPPNLRLGNYF